MVGLERDIIKCTIRGLNRVVILWLISRNPMSGYHVIKELERLTGHKFHSGVVYPLLYEMEENNLITGKWSQKGRRKIKYYQLTHSFLFASYFFSIKCSVMSIKMNN